MHSGLGESIIDKTKLPASFHKSANYTWFITFGVSSSFSFDFIFRLLIDLELNADYDDFQNRKDVRENAWRKPGWDEVVAYTGKLLVLFYYLHKTIFYRN